ncbi:hypothetical protein R1flu_010204 [Riccia fluitans]|uniref:Elongator complex protein 1 n=1 Tax=Riccia fluitans TaxID=41844 RepID=A0ABD1Z8I8_9MARC
MRNLQVFLEERVKLKLDGNRAGERIIAAAYDSEHIRVFFASDACRVYGINLLSAQEPWSISLLDVMGFGDPAAVNPEDRVICMEYLLEKEALVLAMASGDILQLTPSTRELEVVGAVAGGIVSMALSPDGELLVVATGAGQLLLMTQDWDVLYENPLNKLPGSSTSGLIPPGGVQISWRGDGKYFATLAEYDSSSGEGTKDSTSSLNVWERETGALHSCGDPITSLQPALSWSPNGSRIATAFSRADSGKSLVGLFFERNGLRRDSFEILGPQSATVDALLWNADSELLAVLIRSEDWDAVQVWNCNNYHWYLKQEWRFRSDEKVNVFWDPEKPFYIMLWTALGCLRRMSLCWKSSVLEGETSFVIDGDSLLVTPLFLSVIPPPMYSFRITFPVSIQTVTAFFEHGGRCFVVAALADGSLSISILPEVSAWSDLEGEELRASPVKSDPAVDFGKLQHISLLSAEVLVGALFHGDLQPDVERKVRTSSFQTRVEQAGKNTGNDLLEFQLRLGEEAPHLTGSEDAVISEKGIVKLVSRTTVDKRIVGITVSPLNSCSKACRARIAEAFVQLADGSVALYSSMDGNGGGPQTGCSMSLNGVTFPAPCPWMRAVAHKSCEQDQVLLIGLNESGLLHAGNQLVSSNCTSFSLHESLQQQSEVKITHLVFTTRLDTLHTINMEEVIGGVSLGEETNLPPPNKVSIKSEGSLPKPPRVRKVKGDNTAENSLKVRPMWERGARLVATIGGTDVAVILQTIRGNLETIYPRGLVLGAIASVLMQENYADAMVLARRNRINLNVVVDYQGWEEFARNADIFVKQISNLNHITELIGALNKDNVMESTYKNLIPLYKKTRDEGGSWPETSELSETTYSTMKNKIRGVLASIRSALEKEVPDSSAREMCILTTHAKSDPPELEAALERVKALREAEIRGIRGGDISCLSAKLSAEAAVKHLIWLTDADSVFNVALGLYDLHLAAIVASHAQRDPKEFLPLLEELGSLPSPHMRYTIDCRLGRYESAMRNCVQMGEDHFENCVKLMRANPTLFPTGLQLYKDQEKKNQILDAWGDYLLDEKKFDDAGATFCACSRFERALDSYRLGGQWEHVMVMAGRLGKSASDIRELAVELRDELEAMGRPKEAARIALDYLEDVEGSMRLLLDAQEWAEVARLGYLKNQQQLIETQLQPAVLECATTQLRELSDSVEKVGKYLARFLALHQRRMLLSARLRTDKEGEEGVDFDASSDISLASSNASGLSGLSAYTRGSRENTGSTVTSRGGRRVSKSKGGKIRAGSPGEEMAIVEHLRGTALSGTKLEEQRLLLQALLQLGHEEIARKLQRTISHFIHVQKEAIRQAEEKIKGEHCNDQIPQLEREQVEHSSSNPDVGAKDVHWKWEVLQEQ